MVFTDFLAIFYLRMSICLEEAHYNGALMFLRLAGRRRVMPELPKSGRYRGQFDCPRSLGRKSASSRWVTGEVGILLFSFRAVYMTLKDRDSQSVRFFSIGLARVPEMVCARPVGGSVRKIYPLCGARRYQVELKAFSLRLAIFAEFDD